MDLERITITCKKSILAKIDSIIDGAHIRNRSHAIEYLISQTLTPRIGQAVILAGGKGINMRPFTFEMPKGLFPVGGKPILEHIIDFLHSYGVRDVIFSIGHLGEKIRDYFGDGKKFGMRMTYVSEEKEMGTGGALLLSQKYITGDTFLVIAGDILIDINLSDLIAFHKEEDCVATLALTSVVDTSHFGEVVLHGTKITQFREKPQKGKQKSQLVNCGLYVLNRSIFDYIPRSGISHLEDIFPTLASSGKLAGFLFEGKWVDIGTVESYERAITLWGGK